MINRGNLCRVMEDSRVRWILFAVGLILIAFNLFWLYAFEFTFNLFTVESWVMVFVGIILTLPVQLPPEKQSA